MQQITEDVADLFTGDTVTDLTPNTVLHPDECTTATVGTDGADDSDDRIDNLGLDGLVIHSIGVLGKVCTAQCP